MKKIIAIAVLVTMVMVSFPAIAVEPPIKEFSSMAQLFDLTPAVQGVTEPCKKMDGDIVREGQAGHLILENKYFGDDIIPDWTIKEDDGIWGRFVYFIPDDNGNGEFSFRGYGLDSNKMYTLLSYDEESHNTEHVIVGYGTPDATGYLFIQDDTPTFKYYTYTGGEYGGITGAKIWLVNFEYTSPTVNIWGVFNWADMNDCLWETELIEP